MKQGYQPVPKITGAWTVQVLLFSAEKVLSGKRWRLWEQPQQDREYQRKLKGE